MRTAAAGRPIARRGRLNKAFLRVRLSHFMKQAAIGGNNEGLVRQVAGCFQDLAGPERGGLLAALVLGRAQVELSVELRQAFRVAGLSHVLAASGFHLSVLLGADESATVN